VCSRVAPVESVHPDAAAGLSRRAVVERLLPQLRQAVFGQDTLPAQSVGLPQERLLHPLHLRPEKKKSIAYPVPGVF